MTSPIDRSRSHRYFHNSISSASASAAAAASPATTATAAVVAAPSWRSDARTLAPLFAITFCGFLAVGLPLAALALYARSELHLSTTAIGWIIGIQSLTTVLTRHQAGTLCDARGARTAVMWGLPFALVAAVCFMAFFDIALGATGPLVGLVAGRVGYHAAFLIGMLAALLAFALVTVGLDVREAA
jgi:nitrate/nitrite transporter NarK